MSDGTPQPELGLVVAEKYLLTRLLGRGGMGSVWEGIHQSLGTRVAVKFIESEYSKHPDLRDRFLNEARAAARLRSNHIVQIYDHGVNHDGRPYIVMEYLSGEPLDVRLAREGALPVEDVAPLISQLSRGLKRAHDSGIIHRDLKPENIFLVWDEDDHRDVVKIVDFGIAKFSDDTGISSSTRTGAVMGTPHFMSPEQARGLKAVDLRSDIWSVGVIAYRAVTGTLPFDGQAMGDLLVKICTQPAPRPSDSVPVPPGFDAWLERSLAKEPSERFSSAEEQSRALSALVGTPSKRFSERPARSAASATPHFDTEAGVSAGLPRPRSGSFYGTIALVGLALLLGTGGWFFSGFSASSAPPPELPEEETLDPQQAEVRTPIPPTSGTTPDPVVDPTEPTAAKIPAAPSAQRPSAPAQAVHEPAKPARKAPVATKKPHPPVKRGRSNPEDELGY